MRTAHIKISTDILFDLIGLRNFDGDIVSALIDAHKRELSLNIIGDDDRLPDKEDFPESIVICHHIDSVIEERK